MLKQTATASENTDIPHDFRGRVDPTAEVYLYTTKQTILMKNLKSLFLAELADIYDAEKRIAKALPKLAKAATHNELK